MNFEETKPWFYDRIELGKIHILIGHNAGKYPFCNSIVVDDEVRAIFDPGCSQRGLRSLSREMKFDQVILSHYHEDHTQGASYFEQADILIHPDDYPGVESVQGLLEAYGATDILDRNIMLNYIVHGLMIKDLPQARPLPEMQLDFGTVKAVPVHTPGHTPGHCCFLFPDQGLLFSADIDLDPFGPYYGDAVSSVNDMLASIDTVMEIAPETILTGHTEGIVTGDIQSKLIAFREKIFAREERVRAALDAPISTAGLVKKHLIYGKQYEPRTIFNLIERNMISQHLTRLVSEGAAERIGQDLFIRK